MTVPTPPGIRASLWCWLIAAMLAGHYQLLRPLLGPAIPALVFSLTALVLVAYLRLGTVRAWLDGLDLRALVLFHVTRFIGIYFLLLHQRGELPAAFAVPAGWGDIVVASGALAVAPLPRSPKARLRAISLWNVVGLADILFVVATAARLVTADAGQMAAFTRLPLSLLPSFLVPLIIATHVIIYLRVRRALLPVSSP